MTTALINRQRNTVARQTKALEDTKHEIAMATKLKADQRVLVALHVKLTRQTNALATAQSYLALLEKAAKS